MGRRCARSSQLPGESREATPVAEVCECVLCVFSAFGVYLCVCEHLRFLVHSAFHRVNVLTIPDVRIEDLEARNSTLVTRERGEGGA